MIVHTLFAFSEVIETMASQRCNGKIYVKGLYLTVVTIFELLCSKLSQMTQFFEKVYIYRPIITIRFHNLNFFARPQIYFQNCF
jgi:hypothetical protein